MLKLLGRRRRRRKCGDCGGTGRVPSVGQRSRGGYVKCPSCRRRGR